jgi:hypothetical protein
VLVLTNRCVFLRCAQAYSGVQFPERAYFATGDIRMRRIASAGGWWAELYGFLAARSSSEVQPWHAMVSFTLSCSGGPGGGKSHVLETRGETALRAVGVRFEMATLPYFTGVMITSWSITNTNLTSPIYVQPEGYLSR